MPIRPYAFRRTGSPVLRSDVTNTPEITVAGVGGVHDPAELSLMSVEYHARPAARVYVRGDTFHRSIPCSSGSCQIMAESDALTRGYQQCSDCVLTCTDTDDSPPSLAERLSQ